MDLVDEREDKESDAKAIFNDINRELGEMMGKDEVEDRFADCLSSETPTIASADKLNVTVNALPAAIVKAQKPNAPVKIGFSQGAEWALVTMDSLFWLWDFQNIKNTETGVLAYDRCKGKIINAFMLPPREGVFAAEAHVKAVIILITATTISLVLLREAPEDKSKLALFPSAFECATEGVEFRRVVGTTNGRLFMAGNDGSVHELAYQARDGWVYKKCRKIKHAFGFLPASFSLPLTSSALPIDPLVDLVVDESRQAMFSLSQNGVISAFALGTSLEDMRCVCQVGRDTYLRELRRRDFYLVRLATVPTSDCTKFVVLGFARTGECLCFRQVNDGLGGFIGGLSLVVDSVVPIAPALNNNTDQSLSSRLNTPNRPLQTWQHTPNRRTPAHIPRLQYVQDPQYSQPRPSPFAPSPAGNKHQSTVFASPAGSGRLMPYPKSPANSLGVNLGVGLGGGELVPVGLVRPYSTVNEAAPYITTAFYNKGVFLFADHSNPTDEHLIWRLIQATSPVAVTEVEIPLPSAIQEFAEMTRLQSNDNIYTSLLTANPSLRQDVLELFAPPRQFAVATADGVQIISAPTSIQALRGLLSLEYGLSSDLSGEDLCGVLALAYLPTTVLEGGRYNPLPALSEELRERALDTVQQAFLLPGWRQGTLMFISRVLRPLLAWPVVRPSPSNNGALVVRYSSADLQQMAEPISALSKELRSANSDHEAYAREVLADYLDRCCELIQHFKRFADLRDLSAQRDLASLSGQTLGDLTLRTNELSPLGLFDYLPDDDNRPEFQSLRQFARASQHGGVLYRACTSLSQWLKGRALLVAVEGCLERELAIACAQERGVLEHGDQLAAEADMCLFQLLQRVAGDPTVSADDMRKVVEVILAHRYSKAVNQAVLVEWLITNGWGDVFAQISKSAQEHAISLYPKLAEMLGAAGKPVVIISPSPEPLDLRGLAMADRLEAARKQYHEATRTPGVPKPVVERLRVRTQLLEGQSTIYHSMVARAGLSEATDPATHKLLLIAAKQIQSINFEHTPTAELDLGLAMYEWGVRFKEWEASLSVMDTLCSMESVQQAQQGQVQQGQVQPGQGQQASRFHDMAAIVWANFIATEGVGADEQLAVRTLRIKFRQLFGKFSDNPILVPFDQILLELHHHFLVSREPEKDKRRESNSKEKHRGGEKSSLSNRSWALSDSGSAVVSCFPWDTMQPDQASRFLSATSRLLSAEEDVDLKVQMIWSLLDAVTEFRSNPKFDLAFDHGLQLLTDILRNPIADVPFELSEPVLANARALVNNIQ